MDASESFDQPLINDLILVTPEAKDSERTSVILAWRAAGGQVAQLGRFWEPPALPADRIRIYGPLTFSLVLQEIWPVELVSAPDDTLLHLDHRFVARQLGSVALGDAERLPYPRFAKPIVSKLFSAGVYRSKEELASATAGLDDQTLVMWSDVVSFTAEARFFCMDRNICASAVYEGTVEDFSPATRLATEVIESIEYSGPLVLDVGFRPDLNGWSVIELNEPWGAGLNGCDAAKALPVIAASTRPADRAV